MNIVIISPYDVLAAHFLIADYFLSKAFSTNATSYYVGGVGIKDINMFLSSTDRQINIINYASSLGKTLKFFVSATLFWGLIKNHPFHDANKRTATLSLLLSLWKNGYRFKEVNQKTLEKLALRTAENTLIKSEFSKYYKKYNITIHRELIIIGNFIKKNVIPLGRKIPSIRCETLKRLLAEKGYVMKGPENGKVSIYKKERFLFRPYLKRVYQFKCIDMHREISKRVIKEISKAIGLSVNALLSEDILLLESLIGDYKMLLERLANK